MDTVCHDAFVDVRMLATALADSNCAVLSARALVRPAEQEVTPSLRRRRRWRAWTAAVMQPGARDAERVADTACTWVLPGGPRGLLLERAVLERARRKCMGRRAGVGGSVGPAGMQPRAGSGWATPRCTPLSTRAAPPR
jgi:hypothetical protein